METAEIGKGLVALCREGKFDEAMAAYYGEDIVSVEADGETVEGLAACVAKGEEWYALHEIHGVVVEGPFVAGNQFVVRFQIDMSVKATGARFVADEVGLYIVRDGKIVHETFLYLSE